jgi:ribosomal protein S18 acetylase RimI-like enzyme
MLCNTTDSIFVLANSPKLTAVCLLKAPGTCPKTTDGRSYLGFLAVDPDQFQRGYGAATLKQAESFAKERWDAKRLELGVVNTRVQLRTWYEKNGVMTCRVTRFTCAKGLWPWRSPDVAHTRVT